jgi:hypothetical protein
MEGEVIQGEASPVNGGALVKFGGGALVRENPYLPAMTMDVVLQRRDAVIAFTKKIMKPDVDFGVITSTNKPSLLKPGAEKLINFFGLEPVYEEVREVSDWTGADHGGEPLYYIRYRCRLVKDGRVLGSGEGSANTWEIKYRYRWARVEDIPAGVDPARLKSRGGLRDMFEPDFAIQKAETGGKYGKPAEYWDTFKTEIAAGRAKRGPKMLGNKEYEGWTIKVNEKQYRVPNPEFADLINTIQKMSQKRALIAATLIATSASEFFTQDVEDLPRHDDAPPVESDPDPATTQASGRGPAPATKAKAEKKADPKPFKATDADVPEELGGTAKSGPNPKGKPWKTFREMIQVFRTMADAMEDAGIPGAYADAMNAAGVAKPEDFKSTNDALTAFRAMEKALQETAEDVPETEWPEGDVQ